MYRYKSDHGFTLIELMMVVSIIAFLSSILLASVVNAKTKAQDAATVSEVHEIQTGLTLYQNDHGGYPNPTASAQPVCISSAPCMVYGTVVGSDNKTLDTYDPGYFSSFSKIKAPTVTANGVTSSGYAYICSAGTSNGVCADNSAYVIYSLSSGVQSQTADGSVSASTTLKAQEAVEFSNLQKIQAALEQYKSATGSYPNSGAEDEIIGTGYTDTFTSGLGLVPNYLSQIPFPVLPDTAYMYHSVSESPNQTFYCNGVQVKSYALFFFAPNNEDLDMTQQVPSWDINSSNPGHIDNLSNEGYACVGE